MPGKVNMGTKYRGVYFGPEGYAVQTASSLSGGSYGHTESSHVAWDKMWHTSSVSQRWNRRVPIPLSLSLLLC